MTVTPFPSPSLSIEQTSEHIGATALALDTMRDALLTGAPVSEVARQLGAIAADLEYQSAILMVPFVRGV